MVPTGELAAECADSPGSVPRFSHFRENVMRASLWDENAQQAERAASNQSHGIEPLLLTLIDEIRGLRQELREAGQGVNAR